MPAKFLAEPFAPLLERLNPQLWLRAPCSSGRLDAPLNGMVLYFNLLKASDFLTHLITRSAD